MRRRVTIPVVATLLLNACQPIVVRVGKRNQGTEARPSFPYQSEADIDQISNWNSVEDFLQHLDEIKQLGRDALIKRYHEDGRQQIRQAFRQFRDAVEARATRAPLGQLPYLGEWQAGTCVPLRVRDIFDLEPYGNWRALLETVFLSRIQPGDAIPEPEIPGAMDTITKLGFFELGIAMDGQSAYETQGDTERQGSDLRWKVIHEQSEPIAWSRLDESGVQFRFLRTHKKPDHTLFRLDARVGPQVYEQNEAVSLPSLLIDYQRIFGAAGESQQTILIQTGWKERDGPWQKLQLSRRFTVSQDIHQGHILHISASENWQKPDELEHRFRLDINARNLCSELSSP